MTSKRSARRSKELRAKAADDAVEPTWTTRDGRVIRVSDMDDTHVLNTLRHLERRIEEEEDGAMTAAGYAGGESIAAYYSAQAMDDHQIMAAVLTAQRVTFRQEAERRRLDVDRWCVTCQTFHAPSQETCVMAPCSCGRRHPAPVNDFHRKALGCSSSA